MTLDEALAEAVLGVRITAPHLADGVYIEHTFARGYLKFFPSGSNCEFNFTQDDLDADWSQYGGELAEDLSHDESDEEPGEIKRALAMKVGLSSGWGKIGKPTHPENTPEYLAAVDALIGTNVKIVGETTSFDILSGWGRPLTVIDNIDATGSVACPVCNAIHDGATYTECQVCDGKDAATAWDIEPPASGWSVPGKPVPKSDGWSVPKV